MSRKVTTFDFISRARAVHGGKYDYTKARYVKAQDKITIICPTHGEFLQTPHHHTRGRGCPECYGNALKSTKQFINEATSLHSNRYLYNLVNYKNSYTPVTIKCRKHGEFRQTPANHLAGKGCPSCAISGFNKSLPAVLYIVKLSLPGREAIGYGVTRDLKTRLARHRSNLRKVDGALAVLHTVLFGSGLAAVKMEGRIANAFKQANIDIDGFRTETAPIECLPKILELVSA